MEHASGDKMSAFSLFAKCVGIFEHGHVQIITNDHGNRTTPSYVAFTDSECLIGDAAKNQVTRVSSRD
jgi:molecular chaperone DnaK (HSP70)